jgi:hypothetical protein
MRQVDYPPDSFLYRDMDPDVTHLPVRSADEIRPCLLKITSNAAFRLSRRCPDLLDGESACRCSGEHAGVFCGPIVKARKLHV